MMNASEEWKSLWPISSVHSPPLLLCADAAKKVGPLIFKPQTHHHLFSIPSVSPQIPPPSLNNSFFRFLDTSSSILPSTTTSIASQLSSSSSNPDPLVAHNSLQLMRCPGTDSTLAFFPTGSNADQVGFIVLSVKNSQLKVRGDCGITDALTSINALSHRIVNISVSQLPDCECTSGESTIGYLLVSTTYSIYYYSIRIRVKHSGKIKPRLELIGNKLFKSSAIVNACWSPHSPEESVVLLDTGVLYLFNLDSCSDPILSSPALTWKRSEVLSDESVIPEKGGWLSSDFSWHPRILIVVHSGAVFLVDNNKSKVTRLLELGTENGVNDRFLAFSVAAHDRFYFSLASNHMLYLCDIRKPMTPILLWAHNVANPSNIMVSSLSDLRSQSDDVMYSWASEAGYGILLGSFWNGEFSMFCYGPEVRELSSTQVTDFGKSFYAWGLPSNLSVVTGECLCSSCLLKEDFCKDELPNWQQNKEFLLGFGILDKEISSKLFEPDCLGGFSLVTLTSLGNLESQKYCASWDSSQTSGKSHIERDLNFKDSALYDRVEEDYKFKKVFQYFKFNWLDAYLKSDLAKILSTELVTNPENGSQEKASFGQEFHENICQKLVTFGSQGSLNIQDVLKDVSLPTSIHEIALRSLWANLPKKMLRFGFSTYSDLPNDPGTLGYVPCELLEVPCEQPHLPPFVFRSPSSRSSKWSDKQKPSSSLVGPVIPIPFLMTLHKTRMLKEDNIAADSEIDLECDKVMKVVNETTSSASESSNDHIVSLAEDNEDAIHGSQNLQQFASYKPVAFSSRSLVDKPVMKDSISEDVKHTNIIFRSGQKDMEEVFRSHCGLKFKADVQNREIGPNELKALNLLKRQFSNFKQGFSTYQDFKAKSNIP